MDTGIPARNGHLQGPDWMEADKYPEIVFKATSLKRTGMDDASKKETWAYEGEISIHGVTKALKGEATVQRVPEELGKKLGAGSWVKVHTEFPVTLKDFDIKVPEIAAAKVNPTWDVRVDIFGTTELPKPKSKE
jgi:polyisoprenoid-binding protein YceI